VAWIEGSIRGINCSVFVFYTEQESTSFLEPSPVHRFDRSRWFTPVPSDFYRFYWLAVLGFLPDRCCVWFTIEPAGPVLTTLVFATDRFCNYWMNLRPSPWHSHYIIIEAVFFFGWSKINTIHIKKRILNHDMKTKDLESYYKTI
jgi:hypothetical protein